MVFLINICFPSVFICKTLTLNANGETNRQLRKLVFYQDEGVGGGGSWCNQIVINFSETTVSMTLNFFIFSFI